MARTRKFKDEMAAAEWLRGEGYQFCGHLMSSSPGRRDFPAAPISRGRDSDDSTDSVMTMWKHSRADEYCGEPTGIFYGDGTAELYPAASGGYKFYVRLLRGDEDAGED